MRVFPIILLLVFGLVSCTAVEQSESAGAGGSTHVSEGLVIAVPTETHTSVNPTVIESSPTVEPTKLPTSTVEVEPTELVEDRLTPVSPVISPVCTPLEDHPIDELPLITSAPYDPPPPGKEQRHHGVDFSYYRRGERTSIQGVVVQSVLTGRVAASVDESFPYGNFVIIETPVSTLPAWMIELLSLAEEESLYLLYAHMLDPSLVRIGEEVEACQSIGLVGASGNAVEPHLHLEARIGPSGASFDGMAFYHTQTTQEERSNYTLWRTSGTFRHFDPMILLTPRDSE
ncbi:MAG: peptidoglycan DD-metalloendopeptidase family protein [Chloroflexota bacterium]|nr:peptidoglycan DD-metalloendopeptidase family protein [Chloroflexota bacterium]